jgi:hypothetical protein
VRDTDHTQDEAEDAATLSRRSRYALVMLALGVGVGFVLWRRHNQHPAIDGGTAAKDVVRPADIDSLGTTLLDSWATVADVLSSHQDSVGAEGYLATTDDTGGTTIAFGGGERGARPPTGERILTPTYRRGLCGPARRNPAGPNAGAGDEPEVSPGVAQDL